MLWLVNGDVVLVVVVVSAIWVYFDAKAIGVKKGQVSGFADMGPVGWFFVTLLLWIIGLPLYLVKRSEFKRVNATAAASDDLRKCPQCAEDIKAAAIKCRFCGANVEPVSSIEKPTAKSRRGSEVATAIVGVIVLMLIVFSFYRDFGSNSDESGALSIPQSPLAPPPVVTKAEYDQIREGMTYEQVRAIISAPGEELSRTDIGGYTSVMYSWSNSNGSNMNAMFQKNALVSKAQFGLR